MKEGTNTMGGDTGKVIVILNITFSIVPIMSYCFFLINLILIILMIFGNQVIRALVGFAYPSYQSLQVIITTDVIIIILILIIITVTDIIVMVMYSLNIVFAKSLNIIIYKTPAND